MPGDAQGVARVAVRERKGRAGNRIGRWESRVWVGRWAGGWASVGYWRRRHQYRARACHYRTRGARPPN